MLASAFFGKKIRKQHFFTDLLRIRLHMQKIKQSYKDFKTTLQMITEKTLLGLFEQQNRCDRA